MAGDKTYITDSDDKLHRATRIKGVTPSSIVWSSNPNDYTVQVLIDGKWHRAVLTCDVETASFFDNINIDKALVEGDDGKLHTALIVDSVSDDVNMSPIPTDDHSTIDGTTTGETALNVYSEEWANIQWQDNVNVYKVLVTGSDGKVHTALLTTHVKGTVDVIIRGVSPLSLPEAVENGLQYLKAFGDTEQRNVPEGYDELEYIVYSSVGDDKAYVDTGFTPTLNTKARVKFSSDKISYLGFFGARTDPYRFSCTTFSAGAQFAFSLSNNTWSNNKTNFVVGQIYDCIAENGKQTINGTEYEEPVVESWGNCGTFKLVGVNTQGAIVESQQTKFYLCQIWESGVLVRNLVPAQRKSDSVIGMYDTVTQTFFTNAGTGTFIAGPVKYLPDNYTRLQYITNFTSENTKTKKYTGIVPTDGDCFECRFINVDSTNSSLYLIQSRKEANVPIYGVSGSLNNNSILLVWGGSIDSGGVQLESSIRRETNHVYYIKVTTGNGTAKLYVKDETTGTEDTQTGSYTYSAPSGTDEENSYYVWGNNANVAQVAFSVDFVRVTNGSTTKLDYRAAQYGTTVGFYDCATNSFISDFAPGSVVAGPVVNMPTPDAPLDIWCNNGALRTAVYNQILYGGNFAYSSSVSSADCSFTVADNVCSMLATAESGRIWLTNSVTNGHKYLYTVDVKSTTATDKIQLRIAGGGIKFSVYSSDWQTISSLYTANSANASLGVADTRSSNWDTVYIKNAMVFDLTLMFGAGNEPTTTADAFAKIAKVYGQPMEYYPRNDGTVKTYAVGTVETIAIKDDQSATIGTATCVDLLSIGTVKDEQEVIAGNVTRKVGVKVLDGTEDWSRTDARAALTISDAKLGEDGLIPVCSHYVGVNSIIQVSSMPDNSCKINASSNMLMIKDSTHNTDLTAWKQWLANQYAVGTPVIVVYPLATPTSESVTGQPMNVTDGDNIVEITQASIDDLELEVKYTAGVVLSIQEVEDAQLSPDVEVTIQ